MIDIFCNLNAKRSRGLWDNHYEVIEKFTKQKIHSMLMGDIWQGIWYWL